MIIAHWVLVIYMGVAYGGGNTTVEGFTSRQTCEAALQDAVKQNTGFLSLNVGGACVEVR